MQENIQYALAALAALIAVIVGIVHIPGISSSSGTEGSSGSSSQSQGQPSAQPAPSDNPDQLTLHVRDVYNCPSPGDVQDQANWNVYNTSGLALTVYVSDDDGYAYQVLERVGFPAERAWTPKLQNGTYHLTCVFHSDSAVKSEPFQVTGSPITDAPKMVPITDREVAAVSTAHAAAQKQRVPELQVKAQALVDATRSGNRSEAQASYLAYLETYRSFDDASEMWPGAALGGYEDVEKLLFSEAPVQDAVAPAEALADAVDKAAHALQTLHFAIPAPDYGLRTHEVMEEFERFDMRGERDFGAHALPTALRGNVTSTRATMDPVRELVEGRGLDTTPIYDQLDALGQLANEMDAKYGAGGTPTAYDDWEQDDRLRLQAEVARANELLATVATMTVIRRMN